MNELISRYYAKRIIDSIDTYCAGWRDYAKEQIDNLPTAGEEKAMSDLISRDLAIKTIAGWCENGCDSYEDMWCPPCQRSEFVEMLAALPPARPERKRGRWKRHNTYRGDDTSGFVDPDWRCSECGKRANVNEWFMYDLTDFCPNCGADMKGSDDEYEETVGV